MPKRGWEATLLIGLKAYFYKLMLGWRS